MRKKSYRREAEHLALLWGEGHARLEACEGIYIGDAGHLDLVGSCCYDLHGMESVEALRAPSAEAHETSIQTLPFVNTAISFYIKLPTKPRIVPR